MTNNITNQSTVKNTESEKLNPLLVEYLNELDEGDFIDFIIEQTDVEQFDYQDELDSYRIHHWREEEMPRPTLERFVEFNSHKLIEKYHEQLNEKFEEFVLDAMVDFK